MNMFGHYAYPQDNNFQFKLTNVADMGFWIYFTNTTLFAPNGTLGRIAFFLTDGGRNYEYFAEVNIPASALGNWVQIDMLTADKNFALDIAKMEATYSAAAGFFFEYDDFGDFPANPNPGSPYTNIFWIANPYIVYGVNPPLPVKMESIAPATNGLTIWGADGDLTGGYRQQIRSSQEYSWVNGPFPVSYNFTVNQWLIPPTAENTATIALVPFVADGLTGNPDGSEIAATNSLQVVLGSQLGGGVAFSLFYKTNNPGTYPTTLPAVATITNKSAIGTWSLIFNSVTNVTLTGPGTLSTNFNLPDPYGATAVDFTNGNGVYLFFGSSPGNIPGCNYFVSFSDFNVTGITTAFDDNFVADNGTPNPVWDTVVDGTAPQCLQYVTSSDLYWVSYAVPATGYSLYVSPSLTPGSIAWTAVNSTVPFLASTNWVQLVTDGDLPYADEATNAFFAISAPQ